MQSAEMMIIAGRKNGAGKTRFAERKNAAEKMITAERKNGAGKMRFAERKNAEEKTNAEEMKNVTDADTHQTMKNILQTRRKSYGVTDLTLQQRRIFLTFIIPRLGVTEKATATTDTQ